MKYFVLCVLVSVVVAHPEAPYQARGWRPSGQQFTLPSRVTEYGAPSQEYGPVEDTTTTDLPETTEPVPNATNERVREDPTRFLAHYNQASGQYFILSPEGQVQHVAIPRVNNQRNRVQEERTEKQSARLTARPLGQVVRVAPERSGRLQQAQQQVQPLEYFVLTSDGRLQRVQPEQVDKARRVASPDAVVVYPQNTEGSDLTARYTNQQSAQQVNNENSALVVLPDGRFQRVNIAPSNLVLPQQQQPVGQNADPVFSYGAPLVQVA